MIRKKRERGSLRLKTDTKEEVNGAIPFIFFSHRAFGFEACLFRIHAYTKPYYYFRRENRKTAADLPALFKKKV